MAKKYVVVVDTQYDFMMSDGILYVNGSEDLIVPLNKYLSNLSPTETSGVLFTFDTHHADTYSDYAESKMFPLHCEYGTRGWENVINPHIVNDGIDVLTLRKDVFDMWENDVDVRFRDGTRAVFFDRDEILESIKHAGDEVVVVGVAMNFCVATAINGFIKNGVKVTLIESLTAAIDTGNGEADTNPRIFFKDHIASGMLTIA